MRSQRASEWPRWRLVLGGVLAWTAFVAGWWRVASRGRFVDVGWLLAIPALVVVVVLVTSWWVHHNRAIYHRRGPRGAVPIAVHDYGTDRAGRRVEADFAALRSEREVAISVDGDVKTYRADRP